MVLNTLKLKKMNKIQYIQIFQQIKMIVKFLQQIVLLKTTAEPLLP